MSWNPLLIWLVSKIFATRWKVTTSNVDASKDAHLWSDLVVSKNGADSFYNDDINQTVIDKIGGYPGSFNYRDTWLKKVELIMQKVELMALVYDIKNNILSFNDA